MASMFDATNVAWIGQKVKAIIAADIACEGQIGRFLRRDGVWYLTGCIFIAFVSVLSNVCRHRVPTLRH